MIKKKKLDQIRSKHTALFSTVKTINYFFLKLPKMYGCQHLLLKFVLYTACKFSSTEYPQLSGYPTSHKIRLDILHFVVN